MASTLLPWLHHIYTLIIGSCPLLSCIWSAIDLLEIVHTHWSDIVTMSVWWVRILWSTSMMILNINTIPQCRALNHFRRKLLWLGDICIYWNSCGAYWGTFYTLVTHLWNRVVSALHVILHWGDGWLVVCVSNLRRYPIYLRKVNIDRIVDGGNFLMI